MKRLVLFSDGTGNSSAKAQKTNVWRMFQALDQTTPDQLAKYDDGVGTSSNKYLAALGGAFGYGLKRNVIDLYKFVCRNYEAGDQIYGFGFSRGAFTIRVVTALIATQGLVRGRSESELHAKALAAYREYRAERFPSYSPLVWIGRALRDFVLMPWSAAARSRHRSAQKNIVPIEFLGLWDTVGAYGMPIDELEWGFDKLIWPMVAVDTHLLDPIKRCCHALALDEQRQTFTPTLFDETFEAAEVAAGRKPSGRLTQVWFAGVHSNIGGGYPEDRLSLVTLDWMMSQAIVAGLRFDPAAMPDVAIERSGYARLYDSRAGLAAYYRYRPRTIDMGRYPDGKSIRAVVHGSVVMRLAKGSDAYSPISLPEEFDVLAPNGQLIPMHGFPYADSRLAMRDDRPKASVALDPVVDERVKALKTAIEELQRERPEKEMVEQVRDTVLWRRVTYFGTLAATLALIAFPFASGLYAAIVERIVSLLGSGLATQFHKSILQFDEYARSSAGEAAATAGHVLPSYVGLWLHSLARQPLEMITAIVLVAIPYAAGTFLGSRTHDRAGFAWHPKRRVDYVAWMRESFRRSVITAVVVALVLGALTWLAHARDFADTLTAPIQLAFGVSVAVLVWRLLLVARLTWRQRHGGIDDAKLPITPTLWVARKLRNTGWLVAIYRVMALKVIPIAVASLVLIAIGCVLLHAMYFTQHTAGLYCKGTAEQPPQVSDGGRTRTQSGFATSNPCWASGIVVATDRHYRAELQVDGDDAWWFDRLQRTDPAGFAGTDKKHVVAVPLKRIWAAHWFAPILRVGHLGVDDLVMNADCKPDKRCDDRPYDETPDDGTVPTFSPIPPGLAKALVAKDPRPQAPRRATLEFTPQHDGELYIYVNDAVLPIPPLGGPFYGNNAGRATLTVTDVTDCDATAGCATVMPVPQR